MHFRKVTVLLPIALALVMSAREAAAEATTGSATANVAQTQGQGVGSFAGTFSVRVTSGNIRAASTSTEAGFSPRDATPGTPPPAGQGPRTPDPIPGTPGRYFRRGGPLQPIPSAEAVLARPSECPGGYNHFLYRVVCELRRRDSRWGLDDMRGHAPTPSEDIITYDGTNRPDNGESHAYVKDIIGSDCFRGVSAFTDESLVGTRDHEGQQ
jgi:hypothetical protein